MKKIVFFISFLISLYSCAQPTQVNGYITANEKRNQLALIARSFNAPVGTNPALVTGQPGFAGALFVDSTGGNKGLYYYIDGAFMRVYDTADAISVSANNGVSFSTSGGVRLGQPVGGSGATLTETREIPLGAIDGNQLRITSDFTSYSPTFPVAKWEFRTATSVFVQSVVGGGIGFVTLDSTASLGSAGSGISYYSGYNRTLQVGTGLHWQDIDKHFFLSDMRGSITFTSIESGGVSSANFGSSLINYITQFGLLGKVVFGSALSAANTLGDVDNTGSTYLRDTLMLAKRMTVTDSTGFDIVVSKRTSPYEVKMMSVPSLAALLSAGGVSGSGVSGQMAFWGGATTLTTSNNFLVDGSLQTIKAQSLGTTQDDAKGFMLSNSTAAAAGAQQISPSIHWNGRGWKTASTAASQSVDFRAYVLPVQGSINPTGIWKLERSVNGGGYSQVFAIGNAGEVYDGNSFSAGNNGDIFTSQGAGGATRWRDPSFLPFIALTGTSTLTGNVSVPLAGNTFGIGSDAVNSILLGSSITTIGDAYGNNGQTTLVINDATTNITINATGALFIKTTATLGGNAGDAITLIDPSSGEIGVAPNLALKWFKEKGEQLAVIDKAGNQTIISPHYFPSDKNKSEDMAWSYYSRNEKIGKEIFIDMLLLARKVEQLTGEKLVFINDIKH